MELPGLHCTEELKNMESNKFDSGVKIRLTILAIAVLGIFPIEIYSIPLGRVIILIVISLIMINLYRFMVTPYKEINQFSGSLRYKDFSRRFSVSDAEEGIKELRESFNDTYESINAIQQDKEFFNLHNQKVLESISTGIITYEIKSGKIIWINPAFQKMLDIPAVTNIDFIKKRQASNYSTIFEPDYYKGTTITLVSGSNEIKCTIESALFKIGDKFTKIITIQNIDDNLIQNESDAWRKLLSVMTHEIMNSVAPISSLAETLKNNLISGNNQAINTIDLMEGIESIQTRSNGLMKFAKTYRSLNKITSIQKSRVKINKIFHNIYKLMAPSLEEKKIEFISTIDPLKLEVEIDTYLIEQVMINFILNARDAVINTSEPKIELYAKGLLDGGVEMGVIDNGSGIKAEYIDKIFVPFFSTKKQGNGIGLSLCRQIINLHGGRLLVKSKEGKGSKIYCLLPAPTDLKKE